MTGRKGATLVGGRVADRPLPFFISSERASERPTRNFFITGKNLQKVAHIYATYAAFFLFFTPVRDFGCVFFSFHERLFVCLAPTHLARMCVVFIPRYFRNEPLF